jgi:glycosyltransferase involved in cell wall biosynthesis
MVGVNRDGVKLRVWHIAETYPPDYGGGASIGIQELCRVLAARGHEVRVLCAENADREPYTIRTDYDRRVRVDRVNLPYFKTQDPDGWRLGLRNWRAHQRRISALIEEHIDSWTPDIAHYSTSRPFGEECLVAIRRRNVPLIAMLHEAWLSCARLTLLQSPASEPCSGPSVLRCLACMYSHYDGQTARAALKFPWRLLRLGPYPAYRLWRRQIARHSVDAANGISRFLTESLRPHIDGPVIHTPYHIDLSGLPAERAPRPRTPLRFGFVGGFQPIKGIWDVLDAAVALKKAELNFELHIWGPNQETGAASITTRNLGDRVFLRGMYETGERWRVFEEIDVAIMATTVCEALGRVPLEAAAAGVPTIAPAVGGLTETIRDGLDGLLFRFRDPRDLERQMRRVLEERGLVAHLIDNLRSVPNTEDDSAAVEEFYFKVLGSDAVAGLRQRRACDSGPLAPGQNSRDA